MNKALPDKRKATLVYTGTKLGSNFNIKDITRKEHKHDLVYSVKCPEKTCNETDNGETGRRLIEQVDERRVKDKNSHVYQDLVNSNHALVTLDDFTILNLGYKHIASSKGRFQKLYLLKAIDLTLKVVFATFLLVCFVCLKGSTFETRKNVFYFTSKALFVLEIIKF